MSNNNGFNWGWVVNGETLGAGADPEWAQWSAEGVVRGIHQSFDRCGRTLDDALALVRDGRAVQETKPAGSLLAMAKSLESGAAHRLVQAPRLEIVEGDQ